MFEGKDCSFLVVIVCEAILISLSLSLSLFFFFFFLAILTAFLCKDFKGSNKDSLAESQRVEA